MSFSGSLIQNAIYFARTPPEWPIEAADWERAAHEKLEPGAFGYLAGGAGSESTMRANLAAFDRWRIRPRMLTGNASRDISVDVLGLHSSAPFLLAPIGVLSIAHPDAEVAVGKASTATSVPMVLSSAATHSLEEIREYLQADSVAYLSLEGLLSAVGNERSTYCSSCYTGCYPVPIPSDEARVLQLALRLDTSEKPETVAG